MREARYYSITHDAEVARISLADKHGREYFALVVPAGGRGYRERRDDAVGKIQDAIMAGEAPGEVML